MRHCGKLWAGARVLGRGGVDTGPGAAKNGQAEAKKRGSRRMKRMMTVAEYSRHRQLSKRQIYKYLHGGEITASSVRSGQRGAVIDVESADADLDAYFGPRTDFGDDHCEVAKRETPMDERKALFRSFALAVCVATVDEMDRRHGLGLKTRGKLAIVRSVLDMNDDVRGIISTLAREKRRAFW